MIASKYDELTVEQKEAAVGLAAGWVMDKNGIWHTPAGARKPLPLFTSDLDAVSRIEVSLTPAQYDSYYSVLETLCKPTERSRAIIATAEMRCKALVLNSMAVKPVKPAKLMNSHLTVEPVRTKVTKRAAPTRNKILRKTDMVPEACGNCGKEVQIPAYGITKCPACKASIRPCCMCDLDNQPCDFDDDTGSCYAYKRGYSK